MKRSQDNDNGMGSGLVTRRTAIRGISGTGIATALGISSRDHAIAARNADPSDQIELGAGSWMTWVLTSGDQLRPAASSSPPGDTEQRDALAELHRFADHRTTAMLDRISYWDAGSPGYRWNEIALQHTRRMGFGPGDAYRTMALLNVAIYDATISAWDAKYAFNVARPAFTDSTLQTAIPTPRESILPLGARCNGGSSIDGTQLPLLRRDEHLCRSGGRGDNIAG